MTLSHEHHYKAYPNSKQLFCTSCGDVIDPLAVFPARGRRRHKQAGSAATTPPPATIGDAEAELVRQMRLEDEEGTPLDDLVESILEARTVPVDEDDDELGRGTGL